jgi:hypothetical protein
VKTIKNNHKEELIKTLEGVYSGLKERNKEAWEGIQEITEILKDQIDEIELSDNEETRHKKASKELYTIKANYTVKKGTKTKSFDKLLTGFLNENYIKLPIADTILNRSSIFSSLLQEIIDQVKYENDKELKKLRKVFEEKGKGKFKRSGHLTDQILKYNYPKDKQPSLFDSLQTDTLKDIEVAGVEVSEIVEGIKLSPSETKVIDCLCKLLHESSQNLNPKEEDYYSGNIGYELVDYGGDKNTPAPKLAFTLYELTREYKGGEYVAGKDIENVKQILTELDSKRFLLSYVETTKKKDGGRVERKIEDFRKLIHIIKISQTEYNKEDIELSKKEETIILLNPIFRRQIDSKFILYPNDINRRTIIAYGSHNLSDIALRLREYLMRELSSKRYQPEIKQDKLYYLLAEKWMKESRKKKVKEYTDKAIETVKALGLLLSYEIKIASTGEPKVVFTLNKDWE